MPPPVLDQHPWALYLYGGVFVVLAVILRALQSWPGFKGSVAVNIKFAIIVILVLLVQVALKTGYINSGGAAAADGILVGLFMLQLGRKPRKPLS